MSVLVTPAAARNWAFRPSMSEYLDGRVILLVGSYGPAHLPPN